MKSNKKSKSSRKYAGGSQLRNRTESPFYGNENIPEILPSGDSLSIRYSQEREIEDFSERRFNYLNNLIWYLCIGMGFLAGLLLLAIGGSYLFTGLYGNSISNHVEELEEFTEFLNDTCCNEFDENSLCELAGSQISFSCLSDVDDSEPMENQIVVFKNETYVTVDPDEICPTPCINGTDGQDGEDGLNCWDINGNGLCDVQIEDVNDDGVCNQTDCIGDPGRDGMDGANATIDECEKPFGQLCFVDGDSPNETMPYELVISQVNTWLPLSGISCMIKKESNVNVSMPGCFFTVTHNDSYKITIDTSFVDDTPPDEVIWVGLSIDMQDPLITSAFPSDSGNHHTLSFDNAVYLTEGQTVSVKFYSLNSIGTLHVFRLQFTIVGELLCGFDVTGPMGPQGLKGDRGDDGFNCWDINENYFCDLELEDINGDGICSVADCTLDNITFANVTGDICPRLEESGNLTCMSDVNIQVSPNEGDFLFWNGTSNQWSNGPITYENIQGDLCERLDSESIGCLSDVNASTPLNGTFLKGDGNVWSPSNITYGDINGDLCEELGKQSIDCLENVDFFNPSSNHVLIFNETNEIWTNGPISYDIIEGDLCEELNSESINCLQDVSASSPENGKFLKGNGTSWIPGNISYPEIQGDLCPELESESIDCMNDVDIHDPLSGQVLLFDTSSSSWENNFLNICELGNVNCQGGPDDGDIIQYNYQDDEFQLVQLPGDSFSCDFEYPCVCGSKGCPHGKKWFNPVQLTEYVCDCRSGNRWLHLGPDLVFEGENGGSCDKGKHLLNDNDCAADFGGAVGGDDGNSPSLGYYIPYDITITAYGISIDDDSECESGNFDSYVCWTTGNSNDEDYDFNKRCVQLTSNNGDDEVNAVNLRLDVPGNRYILWGLKNDCSSTISDWNMVVYYKQRYVGLNRGNEVFIDI